MGRRAFTVLLVGLIVGAAHARIKPAEPAPDSRAQAVYERTKTARTTYALYQWNWRRTQRGVATQHWSAEFHRGNLHRVETPDVRVIADCAAGTGSVFFIASARTDSHANFAKAACGINAIAPIRRLDYLGQKSGRFGPVDTVRLADIVDERIYAVDRNGLLLASEYTARDPASRQCVQNEPLAVEAGLPGQDIFSIESLKQSFVPETYRHGPAAPAGDLWTGPLTCV